MQNYESFFKLNMMNKFALLFFITVHLSTQTAFTQLCTSPFGAKYIGRSALKYVALL